MKLFYRDFNKGEATIILHGLYGSSDNWLSIAKKLDNNNRVIIPDLRNHGQSPHSLIHSYYDMALDIKELCSLLKLNQVNLIGHSMGGKLAMQFACMFPQIVKSLAVIDIAPINYNCEKYNKHIRYHRDTIKEMLNYNFKEKKSITEIDNDFSYNIKNISTRQLILKNIKRNKGIFEWKINIESINNNFYNIFNNSLTNNHLFHKSSLFIKGENSDYIDIQDLKIIGKHFPNSKLISIPNTGHWIHTENPNCLINILNNFHKL